MDAIEYLRDLTAQAPHRGGTTQQERKTAKWLGERLRQMGYTVAEQSFRTTRDNLYLMPAQVFALAAASGCLLLAGHRWLAAAALVYGLAILVTEVSGYPFDLTLMPRFRSQNIYTEPPGDSPATIFVMAHYDTQRGSFLFHPRLLPGLAAFFYFCYSDLVLNLIAVAGNVAIVARIGLGVAVLALAIFVLAQLTGRYTPGANDNGSGVALALYLADDYARRRAEYPDGCELRFLFNGCEEAGEKGMKAFLREQRTRLDKRRTLFVNLDNLGTGRLTFLSGEGVLMYRRAGSTLLAAARQTGAAAERKNLLLPTDALPASALGYEAISFLGLEANGHPGNYHWYSDTFENVDPEFLRSQQQFFKEYLAQVMRAVAEPRRLIQFTRVP